VIWLLSTALAQDLDTKAPMPAVHANPFRPSIDNPWMIRVDESGVGGRWHSTGRELVSYANRPLAYTAPDGTVTPLLEHVQQEDTMASSTFWRLRLGTSVPYYSYVSGETDKQTGRGDWEVDLKGMVLDRSKMPLGLALSARLAVPIGTVEGLTYGRLAYEVQAIADQRLGPWLVVANLGHRGQPRVELDDLVLDDQLLVRAGLGWIPDERYGGALEYVGAFTYASMDQPGGRPQELMGSAWVRLGERFTMRLGAGPALSRGVGQPRVRAAWAFAYEPPREEPVADTDGDGLDDSVDRCVDVPEDLDDWRDHDGCPEPTEVRLRVVDQDGIPVTSFAARVGDKGFPVDGAPLEPGRHFVHVQAPGFAPTSFEIQVPEGPPVELGGSLDPLELGTLVVRIVDPQGRDIPGAFWALDLEDQGAAGQLQLQSGIVDVAAYAEGYLPASREVRVEPDVRSELTLELEPTAIRVTETKIDLGGGVIFFETNRAVIRSDSFELLEDVATVLIETPEIELVRIEGHTDARADEGFNLRLSEQRAEAVRAWLIQAGVEAERLQATGFGETRPIDPRDTQAAWEVNRRVEFFIESE
jgi:outer membrane protein OmpA-like peptidoglycan-associated protein